MERHPKSWILRWHPVFQTCFQEKGAESDESDVEKGAICTPLHQLVAGCFHRFFVHLYAPLLCWTVEPHWIARRPWPWSSKGVWENSHCCLAWFSIEEICFSRFYPMVVDLDVFFPNSPNSCSLSCLSCCLNLPTLTNFSLQLWGNVLDKYGFWLQSLTTCAGSPSTFPGKYAGGPALPFLDFRIRKMKHWNWKHYILVRC